VHLLIAAENVKQTGYPDQRALEEAIRPPNPRRVSYQFYNMPVRSLALLTVVPELPYHELAAHTYDYLAAYDVHLIGGSPVLTPHAIVA